MIKLISDSSATGNLMYHNCTTDRWSLIANVTRNVFRTSYWSLVIENRCKRCQRKVPPVLALASKLGEEGTFNV